MKRRNLPIIICLLLCVCLVFSACGYNAPVDDDGEDKQNNEQKQEEKKEGKDSENLSEMGDRILIIENNGEGASLCTLLQEQYKVDRVDVSDIPDRIKKNEDLKEYSEIILANISPRDFTGGFDNWLYTYVNDYGGGLFTTGGNRLEGERAVAKAYNREDMEDATYYKQLLPVECVPYSPPRGVVLLIDRSGSMGHEDLNENTTSRLNLAKEGAIDFIENSLSDGDYCGIMTLESSYDTIMPVTPVSQKQMILDAIANIPYTGGSTAYAGGIDAARVALSAVDHLVEKKQIILISDDDPTDSRSKYAAAVNNCAAEGITVSVVSLHAIRNLGDSDFIASTGGGTHYRVPESYSSVAEALAEDTDIPFYEEIIEGAFKPVLSQNASNIFLEISDSLIPELGGVYVTKAKSGAEVILKNNFIPVYAQWDFGKGKVGSFLSTLSGDEWSADFMDDENGIEIILKIVEELFYKDENKQP